MGSRCFILCKERNIYNLSITGHLNHLSLAKVITWLSLTYNLVNSSDRRDTHMDKRTAKRKEAAGGRSRRETSPGNFIRGCSIGGQYLVSGIPIPSIDLHGATLKYYTETVLYLKLSFQIFIYCGRVKLCACLTAAFSRSIIHHQIGEWTHRIVGKIIDREKPKHSKF